MKLSVHKRIDGFTATELFTIAEDVEAYPTFLPFCIAARIRQRKGTDWVVDNVFGIGPFRARFTSHAHFEAPDRITIRSDDRQFKILTIRWTFKDDGAGGCGVTFEMAQVFRSKIKDNLMEAASGNLETVLIERFEARARDVFDR